METNVTLWPELAKRAFKWLLVMIAVMIIGFALLSACGGGEVAAPASEPPAAEPGAPAPLVVEAPRGFSHFIFTEDLGDERYTCVVSVLSNTSGTALAQSCWRD